MKSNLDLAMAQEKDWFEKCSKTTFDFWKKENNLRDGERFPLGNTQNLDITRAVIILPKIKNYLKETSIHEYSGSIYGDMKFLEGKIIDQEKKFEKLHISKDEKSFLIEQSIILSEADIFYISGEYVVLSSSTYYTGCIPSYEYVVLMRSKRPIEKIITRSGNVERHTIGYIKYI